MAASKEQDLELPFRDPNFPLRLFTTKEVEGESRAFVLPLKNKAVMPDFFLTPQSSTLT